MLMVYCLLVLFRSLLRFCFLFSMLLLMVMVVVVKNDLYDVYWCLFFWSFILFFFLLWSVHFTIMIVWMYVRQQTTRFGSECGIILKYKHCTLSSVGIGEKETGLNRFFFFLRLWFDDEAIISLVWGLH